MRISLATALGWVMPIGARSRTPTTVDVSMLSSSARFRRIEHRRLPGRHDVPGPRTTSNDFKDNFMLAIKKGSC